MAQTPRLEVVLHLNPPMSRTSSHEVCALEALKPHLLCSQARRIQGLSLGQ